MANDVRRPDFLIDITLKEVIDNYTDMVVNQYDVTKKDARKMVISALCYSCVANELKAQINYMMGGDGINEMYL